MLGINFSKWWLTWHDVDNLTLKQKLMEFQNKYMICEPGNRQGIKVTLTKVSIN